MSFKSIVAAAILSITGLFSVSSLAAKNDMKCIEQQNSCSKGCIANNDMPCVERCGVDAEKCIEAESAAKEPQSSREQTRRTASSNNSTNLQGCWRAESKLTTWCFDGTTSTIVTDSYDGAKWGKRITGLDRVTLNGTSMTYYIVRAAQTGGYDNKVNKGPYTQPYTYSDTSTPAFWAAGDQYVKQP